MRRPYIERKRGKTFFCYPRQPIGFATHSNGQRYPVFAPGTHLIKVEAGTGRKVQPHHVKLSHGARAMIARQVNRTREREAGQGETGKNLRVERQLESRYGSRGPEVLAQAQEAYHYRNPHAQTNAEPYELAEGGYLDEAVDSLGLHHSPRFDGKPRRRTYDDDPDDGELAGHLG